MERREFDVQTFPHPVIMLLRLFSALFGYNYEVVKTQTTVSKQKIVTMGTLVLIPVSLWFISSYYLSSNLYEVPTSTAICIATGMALLVLVIDRSFIVLGKENGGVELKQFRVFIAILSTCLGSLALDLMVFSGDLKEYRADKNQSMKETKIKKYKEDFGDELDRLNSERAKASDAYDNSYADYIAEVDGSSGTKKYGKGPAASAKEGKMDMAKADYEKVDILFLAEQGRLNTVADSVAQASVINESSSVMSRVKDLHAVAFSHVVNAFYYLVISAFFFCLEFFPFKYKSKTAESLFEKMLYAEEKVGERRLQTLMAKREEILRQDGFLGHRAERIRHLASGYDNIRKIS